MKRASIPLWAAVALLGSLASARPQGLLIPERPIREWPFSMKAVRVSATITDGLAETSVEQTFVNDSPVDQEGTYVFPLPEGASVSAFSLRAGDRVIEGRVLGKEEARGVYESIVRRRRDPALLEYLGGGMFRASVFPIPAHGERVLTLRYHEILKPEGTARKFVVPLSTGRFSGRPIVNASVVVRLKTTAPLKTVYSPSHEVSVRRQDDHAASASWEAHGEFPERDFALYYATSADDIGLSLLTYRPDDRDGYFLLVAAPRFDVPKERILPKQVVFVLDRTGSMAGGDKLQQARKALDYCLDRLNPEDRFGLMTFNESPDLLSRSLLSATPTNVEKAHRFIRDVEATGGTNIHEALTSALSLLKRAPGSQKMVVFLTDGQPTVGETNPETIVAHVERQNEGGRMASADADRPAADMGAHARIFCFGVGYDVNAPLLDRLSEVTRGDSDYVRPQESVEAIVSAFYTKVASPILADIRLAFTGVEAYDIYPKRMPDLFQGTQIVVAGRFRGDGPGAVRLTGNAQGRDHAFRLAGGFGDDAARSALVPRIWAARKIGFLIDEVRLHSNKEVIDEIVRLSRDYGIITPYTSYLADERQDVAFRPRAAAPGGVMMAYDVDSTLMNGLQRDAGADVAGAMKGPSGEAGEAAVGRALSSRAYQRMERAPTSAQSGPAGGGRSGGGFGAPGLMAGGRGRLADDYARVGIGGMGGQVPVGQTGVQQVQQAARVQSVAGRVFYRRGDVWFDNAYQAGQQVLRVRALSDAHFELLRARPDLARYAAVGGEVVLSLGKAAVQIGREGVERLTDGQMRDLGLRRLP